MSVTLPSASSTSTSPIFSSFLNVQTSKTPSLIIPSASRISRFSSNPFVRINIQASPQRKKSTFLVNSSSDSTTILDNPPEAASASSPSVEKSWEDAEDEQAEAALKKIGAKIRVKVPLKVYHIPRTPEMELEGKIGVLKQYVAVHKGKRISANLPYRVEFLIDIPDGKTQKLLAHLKEDEFEFLD